MAYNLLSLRSNRSYPSWVPKCPEARLNDEKRPKTFSMRQPEILNFPRVCRVLQVIHPKVHEDSRATPPTGQRTGVEGHQGKSRRSFPRMSNSFQNVDRNTIEILMHLATRLEVHQVQDGKPRVSIWKPLSQRRGGTLLRLPR